MEIYGRSIKIANYLQTKCNLKQHDIVGVIAANSENIAPIFIACFTLGVAVNPLAAVLNETDIFNIWRTTRPKVIFTDHEILSTLTGAMNRIQSNATIITVTERINGYPYIDDILSVDDGIVNNFE